MGRPVRCCASLLALCVVFAASSASAAPTAAPAGVPKAAKAKPITVKKHKGKRDITKWSTSLPSHAERLRAAGAELTVIEAPWATVSVRTPVATTEHDGPYASFAGDRAALTFIKPEFVDARSGWARWRTPAGVNLPGGLGGGSNASQEQLDAMLCALVGVGCDDGDDDDNAAVDLQLWVNARAGHDYLAVCRVKFDDAAGTLAITADGAAPMSVEVNHAGKQSTTVSFVIDASGAGWYGVGVSSSEAWATTGCTIDEI